MLGRQIAVSMLAAWLLGGCASPGTGPGSDPCVLRPPQQSGIYIYDELFLPVYLLYGVTCEGVQALNRHGAFTPAPQGEVQEGTYRPADGSFSIAAPAGLEIREQLSQERDYVFFAPRVFKGPVYGVVVDLKLDREYASLSLDEYAALALRDARLEQQRLAGTPLQRLRLENLSLDGKPALFEVYSQTPAGSTPPVYYLMYFVKLRDRAAILSISWPGSCSACAAGGEADIRRMDPQLQQFVDSFRLGAAENPG